MRTLSDVMKERQQEIEAARSDKTKWVCDKHLEVINIGEECFWCKEDRIENEKKEAAARKLTEKRISELNMGPRFVGKTFEDYVISNNGQKVALSIAQRIVSDYNAFFDKGTQVLFYGKSGTGKTMLESIIAQELIKKNCMVKMVTVQQMIRSIRNTFNVKGESEQEAIDEYSYTPFLMLDEVGVSLQSDYEKTVLFEILDQRYKFLRPTLMTSNLSVKEVEEYLGFRLMRRFRDSNGLMVPFEWEEYKGNR